jgi:hypothetical protein
MKALPRPFAWVLFAQAACFCACVIGATSVQLQPSDALGWTGVTLFVVGCIALRLAVSMTSEVFTAMALCVHTAGLTLLGCQAVGWLFLSHNNNNEAGQRAVYLGCATFLVALVWGQFSLERGLPPQATTTQSALLILLLAGLVLVTIDDREWDWRYVYGLFFSLMGTAYVHLNTQPMAGEPALSAQHTCALIILQPILFVEDWFVSCLLA